mmetsp:Transcript_25292/g.40571  ORF Transcript_25292/g.40571 Transcript_25292/m.40571 type:complete len:566 (-) Transcript_25292:884-2581(-)
MGGTSENDGKSVAARLSAAEAMRKKINAMLMAKGVLKKGDTPTASPTVSKEISINDSANRNVLMKKSIHVMIENQSKTKVIVKGTYVAPGSTPSPGVRPLYLLLTAKSHEDVAKAEGIINKFISAGKQEKSVPKSSDGGLVIHSKAVKEKKKTPSFSTLSLPKNIGATSKVGVENAKTKKIPISLSISMCKLMEYPLLEKLSGPNNAYLDHINKTSGATVTIRGEGSSMSSSEKLHFHVSAINDSVLNSAVNLAGNLLETIYQDYRVKTGAGSVRTESAPPAPTSAPPSLPPGIIAHGGSQPQPPPHAPAAPAMNYGGYRAPYSNHHPHQPPPGYGSYPPPHGYNNSYYGYNNNNNQQQQQQYPGAYGGQPYYSSGGGPMPIPSMPPTSQYNPARPEYNPAAAASLPYSGPSVVGPEPNQKTAVNSDNSDEDDDGRDRNRSRDRRRDRDDRRRRSESPPRRKRFSEGPVKRKFEEDDESSDGDDSPKRKRSFREEPRKVADLRCLLNEVVLVHCVIDLYCRRRRLERNLGRSEPMVSLKYNNCCVWKYDHDLVIILQCVWVCGCV